MMVKLLEYCLSVCYNCNNFRENKYSYNYEKVTEFQGITCAFYKLYYIPTKTSLKSLVILFIYLLGKNNLDWKIRENSEFIVSELVVGTSELLEDSLQSMFDIDPLNWALNSTSR